MRIDLHTHSDVSDGTDSPADLVAAGLAAGLDIMAIADHDTTDGWTAAVAAAQGTSLRLVPAIEVSTTWRGADVHMLAYWPDAANAALVHMLAAIRSGRRTRVPRMLAGLAAHGVRLSEQDVLDAAGDASSVGRPHVADALVAAGVVSSREEAFATWIGEGMPGHVAKPAPDLATAIGVVRTAGGVCVLAHPWGRGSRSVLGRDDLVALAGHGLAGVEVEHVDHDDDDRAALHGLATDLGLVATGGSDYHGTGKAGVAIGGNLTSQAAYESLLERRGSLVERRGTSGP